MKNHTINYFWQCYKKRKDDDFVKIVAGNNKEEFIVKSFGNNNKEKVYYFIDIEGHKAGFYAIYRFILNALYVADRFGLIPYVRITRTEYNDDFEKKENMFDRFFLQPSTTENELSYSFNVVSFNYAHLRWAEDEFNEKSNLLAGYHVTDIYISTMAEIRRKYLQYNEKVISAVNKDLKSLDIENKRTLGIHYRGNAYKVGFNGHPIGLSPDDYYDHIDNCLREGYDSLFIATDDQLALEQFINRYGKEKVMYYQDTERSSDGIDVHNKANARNNRGFEIGYQVIRDVMTLSACKALLCGISQVTIAAQIEKKAKGDSYCFVKTISKGFYDGDNTKNIHAYEKGVTKLK